MPEATGATELGALEGFPLCDGEWGADDEGSGFDDAGGRTDIDIDPDSLGEGGSVAEAEDPVPEPAVAGLSAPAASDFDPPPPEHAATTRTAAATTAIETPRIAPPFTPATAMLTAAHRARRPVAVLSRSAGMARPALQAV